MHVADLFHLPSYITKKEIANSLSIDTLTENILIERRRVALLEKDMMLLQTKIDVLEKYFTNTPMGNTIDEAGPEEVELTEEMRFPIVDGVKFKFEGDPGKGTPVNIS